MSRRDDPGDGDLAELARRGREELRASAEELEAAVEGGRDRARTLADLALEAMHRGDTVAAAVGSRSFTGHVSHVGADSVTISDRVGNEVDVFLGAVTSFGITEDATTGGRSLASTFPQSFRQCFFEPEASGAEVEVGGALLAPAVGSVALVGADHVVMRARGRRDWVIPLGAIGYLIRR